jgi:drug/metabolite transporter (DMT)-like permease
MLLDDTRRNRHLGIALISLTTLCFASLDTAAKWLIQTLPVVEVVWLRFVLHTAITPVLLWPLHGRDLLRVRRPGLQALRGAMLATMTGLNFWALQYLQLAETGAIQFSVPLLIALMSALWLGERLDVRRWIAIALGFAGVLMVVRPGTQGFHPALLLSVLNALLYAAFNLLTRHMATTEHPAATQLMSAACAALLLTPFAFSHWQTPPDATHWALLVVCGLCGGLGHYGVALAHRCASAAVLGPFLYQQILYMCLFGWLVFGQVPDGFVIGGAAVVVASGLYVLWLEVRHK